MTLLRVALFAAIAMAAQHPSFSGTWNLNLVESDFTDKHVSAPDNLVLTVEQHGDDFKYRLQREKNGKKTEAHVDVVTGLANQIGGDGTASAEWKADKL